MQTADPESDRTFIAGVALVLLVAGLLGYLAIIAFNAVEIGMAVFLVAVLLALILGWIGRSRLPGKIAVGGVCLLFAWCSVVYLMFLHARPADGAYRHATVVEPDTRPAFVLDASKPFVIELGRGSGWSGLDIVKVSESGAVELYRAEHRANAETASLQLSGAAVKELVGLVNSSQLTGMGRTYSDPKIADGAQWVLWIQQSTSQKSIYFNNAFPDQITGFASRLDALLKNAGLNSASWTPAPKQQGTDEQTALWGRIEPAK